MAPHKGKQGTKGQKQIVEENVTTLKFYRNMALGVNIVYYIVAVCVLNGSFTFGTIAMLMVSTAVYIGSYQFMAYISAPKYTESGQLLDSGIDLNMEGGLAEHVKDLIILTSGCQLLSLISNFFWLFWLLAPGRAFWLLWVNVLSPYFFQEAPSSEVDEKKQRKLERRMKRAAH